jgi:Domain of unknown function (DUF1835)/Protein of unknown function
MLHIVFQHKDIDVLKQAIELDASLQGEVIQIEDDFAVGPVKDIYSEEGWEARKQWWRKVLEGGDYDGIADDGSVANDNKSSAFLVESLGNNPSEIIWIWAAQNKHDVCGYYWLMSQLREFQGRVFILFLNNLPFISEKGNIFYPVNLFDIPAKEFLKAKKLARPITPAEFEVDSDEWVRLCHEDMGVRILEGGKKLVSKEYHFYDDEIKKFIKGDWIRASKLVHQFLAKANHITGDAYILWRLKLIIEAGEVDVQGELKNMKDFEVKAKVLDGQI